MRYSVDWLSGTNAKVRDERELSGYARYLTGAESVKPCKGMYGYPFAVKTPDGILFESGARADMGTHIQASGQALTAFMQRAEAYDRLMALIDVIKPARLDLAVDSERDFAQRFADCVKEGKVVTKTHAWSIITSADKGLTVYIGSRSSDRFMRVYNKAAEQGLVGALWTRIEMECKGSGAIAAKGLVMVNGIAHTCRTWIPGFASVEIPEWSEAFDREAVYWHSQKGATNTRRWLLDVAAPAMRKLVDNGDSDIFADFAHEVFKD